MYLTLFVILLGLSLLLITLGLFKPEHSELSLIGFTFLFLLGIVLINNDISIKSGEIFKDLYIYGNNYTGYHWDYVNPTTPNVTDVNLFHSNRTITYTYSEIDLGTHITSRLVGYWLCIASVVGFIGVILGLRKQKY